MWRDRTGLYLSFRQSYARSPRIKPRFVPPIQNGYSDHDDERRGLMADDAGGDAVIEMDILPPRWLDIQDEVLETLDSISKRVARLDTMHNKHVLPGFEDDAVKQKEERDIEFLTQDITRSFQSCQRAIKRIDQMVKEARQLNSIGSAEETMAKNLQISLATRVGESSATFRKKQSNYLRKLRQISGMGLPIDSKGASSSSAVNAYTDPLLLESDADRSLSQSTLQQTAQKRRTNNDTTIAQREKEIEDIAQGIIELANIFSELQTMVIDQGTVLDRIDYNIDRTVEEVKEADKELKIATNYQKRGTKRMIILLLILVIFGLIILLTLKPKRSTRIVEVPSTPIDQPQGEPP